MDVMPLDLKARLGYVPLMIFSESLHFGRSCLFRSIGRLTLLDVDRGTEVRL